jgi:cysteine desulfurase
MNRIYADHAATTRPAPEVLEAMQPWLGESFGNASSVHSRGEAARDAVEAARLEVARLLGAQTEEVVFTASGSESNNLALQGVMRAATGGAAASSPPRSSTPRCWPRRAHSKRRAFALTVVPVRANGAVDPAELAESLGDDVALVSVMAVNNETGVLQPLDDIGPLVNACGARFHVDAVQAPGRIALAVDGWQADLVSLAAHKFHGPLGAAALFVRRRTRLVPLVHGGRHERGLRAGTENVPAIAGMGVAAARAREGSCRVCRSASARSGERLLARVLAACRTRS